MKILLVNPHSGRREPVVYPLGLAYVAGALQDHTVKGCDLQWSSSPREELCRSLDSFRPEIVAVAFRNVDSSASYDLFFYYPAFAECIRTVREQLPECAVVVGGPGFSLFPDRIMSELPEIDFGVLLEAEEAFPDLLAHLDAPEKVNGICWREGEDVYRSPARSAIDFAESDPPDRSVFPVRDYIEHGGQIGVQAKRGCVFDCIYCTYPLIDGKSMRMRGARDVADELQQLCDSGVTDVFFCDSIFNTPIEPAKELCREIIDRGIHVGWKALFNEKFATEEMILLAKQAGCNLFIFGPDGGASRTLESYRKAFDASEMDATYALCRKAGVEYKCAFMMNGPGETLATMVRMLLRILVLRLTSRLNFSLSTMRIYPGTGLERAALERRLTDEDDDLFEPRFYDPFPLRLLSLPINIAERLFYRLTHG